MSASNYLYMARFLGARAVPYIAGCSSVLFAFSPWQTVQQIKRAKSTLQFSFAPFYFYLVQSVIFVLYAYATGNVVIGCTAILGSVMGLHYVYVFQKYAKERKPLYQWLSVATGCLLVLVYHALVKEPEEAKVIIGVPGNILAVVTSIAPLAKLRTILLLKDASSLPQGMSFMNLLSGGIWLWYGLVLDDLLLIVPNFIAMTMGLVQVTLILLYPSAKSSATVVTTTTRADSVQLTAKSLPAPLFASKKNKSDHDKV